MISQEAIDRGGSKLEITRALLEGDTDIPVPNSTWKYYDQSLDSIRTDFEKMRKPLIVRGSHPNDYHGFIDVIPTHRNVFTFSALEDAVRDIEGTVAGEEVRIHSEDWNQHYTPAVHLLIQEQSPSKIVGSMIRHPHDKTKLRIQYADIQDRLSIPRGCLSFALIDDGKIVKHLSSLKEEQTVTNDDIRQVIEMYEQLEKSGVVDYSYSQQMEFGLKPLLFYQARPFKPFQPAQSFDIPVTKDQIYAESEECFGITPPEGIELPFVVGWWITLLGDRWKESPELGTDGKDYGLIFGKDLPETPPIGKKFRNMVAFASVSSAKNYLLHHSYRLMKKAQYSLMEYDVNKVTDLRFLEKSRLFSNGKMAAIVSTEW